MSTTVSESTVQAGSGCPEQPAAEALITGIGMLAPNGAHTEEIWANVLAGRTGIRPVSRFRPKGPVRLAGEVADDAFLQAVPSRLRAQTDRWTQMAVAASDAALEDAGLADAGTRPYDPFDMAVITASSSGGNEFGQRELSRLWTEGPQRVSVYQSIAWFYAATTGQLSIRHGMQGPCGVVVADQAGGLDALAQARRVLRSGTGLVLTGGMEAPLSPYALTCLDSDGTVSHATDPARAYLPFHEGATGWVPGEGGAILVVEESTAARSRAVPHVYGRLAGHAATFDSPSAPPGSGLLAAAGAALEDAGVEPSRVDVVFADAAGVRSQDEAEIRVLTELFGPRGVPVTAPKTMTGRLNAGGGPLDVALAVLAMRDGVIPPTVLPAEPAPTHPLDLVTGRPRTAAIRTALVLARGAGGFNSAVVLTQAY
ncbi:beta-ketoacyl synthase N-terminal-like domain-containing protein [Streptomyces morookaense]|uniref:Ketosynthase chain-length factor n=1 Tax=Streptomyces morookaense TaxID=1970 RepID=A0A7Y7B552_STRMO|nr:beta-ketoacyl synthase N-terminal-like domain-containing protein [Streptomyces morookaense]NVK79152.1 ketosynthase chain-length factor [Streptomyces morookaense]GHF28155.1 actinorhodin polyketide beta-ketoacyl synthase [Streptomyces morookaense]